MNLPYPCVEDTDCAAFDRVEHLAEQLCRESGRDWDRKGTRKAHWRALAAERLREPVALRDDVPLGSMTGIAALLGFGLGWAACMFLGVGGVLA